jgi:hypothetical protein
MMLSLVVLLAVVVALLVLLVIGLLRSYGEVLRRLHAAGIGLEDAAGPPVAGSSGAGSPVDEAAEIARRLDPAVAPPRTGEAASPVVADIGGQTPSGDAVVVGLRGEDRITLLAFLSSGCTTCAGFWEPLRAGERVAVGGRDVRLVVVTGGPQHERPTAIAALAGGELTVVMSDVAWQHYAVPATPYFVLVDGEQVIGEGSALAWGQLVGLLERAVADRGLTFPAAPASSRSADRRANERRRPAGSARGARVDAALLTAGITPGDPRLFESPIDGVEAGSAG